MWSGTRMMKIAGLPAKVHSAGMTGFLQELGGHCKDLLHVCNKLFVKSGISNVLIFSVGRSDVGVSQSLQLLCQGSSVLPSVYISFILTLRDCFPVFCDELQIFWKTKSLNVDSIDLLFAIRSTGENNLTWANVN